MDWESWIRSAAKPPSDTEDAKRQATEEQIRDALATHPGLRGRPYRVYAKGSYANNTNVRLNYDVDIAVEYFGYFYSDLCFDLHGLDKSVVGVVDSSDPYSRADFKADIRAALGAAFGAGAIHDGDIAFRVRERRTTLPADVVPCWEYRRYDRIDSGVPVYQLGSRVFPTSGGSRDNFPQRQLEKGVSKNNVTGRRYKRMVRALKKLQTRMVTEGVLDAALPSYLTECLVYNVPNSNFGHVDYLQDLRAVLATVFNSTLPNGDHQEWLQVHELQYLFRGGFKVNDVHDVAGAAWDFIGFS